MTPSDAPPTAPSTPTPRSRVWLVIEVLNVRLRFVFLMVLVGLVVGYWDNIMNHYDRWRRPAEATAAVQALDIEHYCPMHPNIIRSDPGSCPICGMPLSKRTKSEHAELPEGVLARQQLTPQKVKMGRIATSPVDYQLLSREVRTVGIVDYDETRRAFISSRVKGRIDKLMVNYVGQHVDKGDPLVWIYSPELLTAQQELLLSRARGGATGAPPGMDGETIRTLLDAARQKLLLWGITEEQITQILERGTPVTHLTIYSPIAGFVTEKNVLEGRYVNEGDDLYTIADLSRVWMQAKVFEDEIAGIELDTAVQVMSTGYPNEIFAGRITFLAQTVDTATRTIAARVEIDNPSLKLKPGMYVDAVIRVPVGKVTILETKEGAGAASQPTTDTEALARAYLALSSSYARDTADDKLISGFVEQAKALAKQASGDLAAKATGLADAALQLKGKDLSAQREAFKAVCAKTIELLRLQPPAKLTLYVAYCPMVEADWVQDNSETIINPYMGSGMLHCGKITGTIKPGTGGGDHFATGYYCPVFPDRLFDKSTICPLDQFPTKLARVEKVLAVPASAVINTGTRHIVYRETEPGTFDMLAVELGRRAGEFYPVVSGLRAGDRAATQGAFLVDAENRLNPAAGAQYFGSTGSPQASGQQH